MIKRDTIQRIVLIPHSDGQGGSTFSLEEKEILSVSASITSSAGTISEFGPVQQLRLTVVSDIKLDEYVNTRYKYSGKMFKLLYQIKRGNEYYSTLLEVIKEE